MERQGPEPQRQIVYGSKGGDNGKALLRIACDRALDWLSSDSAAYRVTQRLQAARKAAGVPGAQYYTAKVTLHKLVQG